MSANPVENAFAVRTGFGWRFSGTLLLLSSMVMGCLTASSFIFLPYVEIVFIAASAAALIAVTIAIARLIRCPALRSMGSIMLSALAGIAALPALLLLAFVMFMILPVMPWERNAITSAETFVERNGYTAAGHPENLPLLSNDIMDFGSAEEIAESRRNTVQPAAIGIVGAPVFGYSVLFEYTQPPRRVAGMPRSLFVVFVEADGGAHKPHMMPMYPDWMYKRNER